MIWILFLIARYTLGSLIIWPFLFLNKRLRERRLLELRYMAHEPIHCNTWFHVSSEGEWEQAWPIIEKGLGKGEKIVVWFTSFSLLPKKIKLEEIYPHLHILPLPLLIFNPWKKGAPFSFGRPQKFFMVRYDFFPELVFLSRNVKQSFLLGASLKGKEKSLRKNFLKRFYFKSIISSFGKIFCSNESEKRNFETFFPALKDRFFNHDFRHGQIIKRQRDQEALKETLCLNEIENRLSVNPPHQRLILGSFWEKEIEIFTDEVIDLLKAGKLFIFVAPHLLKGEEFDRIEGFLEKLCEENELGLIKWDQVGIHGEGCILLCYRGGLLCELYPYFGHSYIGGGHGRSIHSVLEPYWGGGHIYCGPRTHRSTEFDFIKGESPNFIHVVHDLDDFYDHFRVAQKSSPDQGHRESMAKRVLASHNSYLEGFY